MLHAFFFKNSVIFPHVIVESQSVEVVNFGKLMFFNRTPAKDFVRLDQDILSPLAGKKKLYTYETMDFWEQIKTPAYGYFRLGLWF